MKVDATIALDDLRDVPALARDAERLGFEGLWTAETRHDPFLPLALAAGHTTRASLGTAIAVAFPRSPTVVAHAAWDLQAASGGRVILGLGTQVKGHIERRFSVNWTAPGPRLREYILALVEKTRGVFYRRSRAFLHFHEDATGLHADVRLAADFERFRVQTGEEQDALVDAIARALADPIT